MPIPSFTQYAANLNWSTIGWSVLRYGPSGYLGYQVTAKVVDQIAHQYPFKIMIKTPLGILGSVTAMAIAYINFPVTFAALCIAYVIATRETTTIYTPEAFQAEIVSSPTGFPSGNIVVHGDLDLRKNYFLKSLPKGLHVKGSLNLDDCLSLQSLPEGLRVEGELSLIRCTGLTSLPQKMHLGRDLNLHGCSEIKSLPPWVTHLGFLSNEKLRFIYLGNTGIPQADLLNLRQAKHPGLEFIF